METWPKLGQFNKKIILTGFQLNIQSDLRLSEHLKH